jgi:dGTPase
MKNKLSKNEAEYLLKHYEKVRALTEREFKEKNPPERPELLRDYGRVLYSSSFRRLQGKMQYLGISQEQFFRNRLTHSLEVEQIAEGIAWILDRKIRDALGVENNQTHLIYNKSEIYVLRMASLAHDLGNPPFGHLGEDTLNQLSLEYGGFEGNAQTLRILRFLEKKSPDYKGLNLTLRSLFSVVKYNVQLSRKRRSKFLYDEDFNFINKVATERGMENDIRTLDAQIMDLADEIAYCAHDLEDALSLKVFDIDEYLHEFYIFDGGGENYKALKKMVDDAKVEALKSDSLEYRDILKRFLTSQIINLLIHDVGLKDVSEEEKNWFGIESKKELRFMKYGKFAEGLKTISFKFVKNREESKIYHKTGDRVLRALYEFYRENPEMMAAEYLKMYEEGLKERAIIDYLAGMMDTYAIKKYEEYFGKLKLGR